VAVEITLGEGGEFGVGRRIPIPQGAVVGIVVGYQRFYEFEDVERIAGLVDVRAHEDARGGDQFREQTAAGVGFVEDDDGRAQMREGVPHGVECG